jgi:Flp pilus assembly protein TadB
MSLSEHEQKVLDQIEQDLSGADQRTPRLLRQTRQSRPRPGHRRMVATTASGVTVGFALVLAGLTANSVALAIVGFLVIVGTLAYAARLATGRGPAKRLPKSGQPQPAAAIEDVRPQLKRPWRRPTDGD